MDALQHDLNRSEAANAILESDLEMAQGELHCSQQENVSLKQEIQQLRELHEQLLQGTAEAEAEATPVIQQCSALEAQVSELRCELEVCSAALGEERAVAVRLGQELAVAREGAENVGKRVPQLEADLGRAVQELECVRRETELQRCRAVLEEARKWETREARLVKRLEELEKATEVQAATSTIERTESESGEFSDESALSFFAPGICSNFGR